MKTLLMAGAVLGCLTVGAATADAQDHRSGSFRHGWGYELGPRETRCEPARRYEDVRIERPVVVYETQTVYRHVLAGYDRCGRPIYRVVAVCEQVPVTRMQRSYYGPSFTYGR